MNVANAKKQLQTKHNNERATETRQIERHRERWTIIIIIQNY